jgi:primary-amine oxidase
MATIRTFGGTLLATVALALPGAVALAQSDRPAQAGRQDARTSEDRMLAFRRRIEADYRANRAMRPPPRTTGPAANGIIELPADGSARSGFSKDDSRPAASEAVQRLVGPAAARPQPPATPPPPCFGGPHSASLLKVFPDVTWHVCVRDMGRVGLWVGPVHLRRTVGGPWITVLYEAGLADIFVPYHTTNFRPYDMRWTQGLSQLGPQDTGLNGSLIWLQGEILPTVVAEVRERGIGWLCKGPNTQPTYRAQEFVVWGISDAGNYDNIIEFGFRDNGAMTMRMGNTGFNAGGPPAPPPVEPHTHVALWRVDMDLNGNGGDTATWLTHGEPGPTVPLPQAQDVRTPFNVEGSRRWSEGENAGLLIEDNATNAFGNRLGYQFVPVDNFPSRHFGPTNQVDPTEMWTQNDIYVTRWSPSELSWIAPYFYPGPWLDPDHYLLTHLNGQSTNGQDLVVWVKSAVDHHPTDEDRSHADLGTSNMTGVTPTHWSGFRIEPYNLFNSNPMGGPSAC